MKNFIIGFALGFFGFVTALIFWFLCGFSFWLYEDVNLFLLAIMIVAAAIMVWGPLLFWLIIPVLQWEARRGKQKSTGSAKPGTPSRPQG